MKNLNGDFKLLKLDKEKTEQYKIKLEKLEEGQKISLMFDPMFKTMFVHSKRIEYSAYLLAGILNLDYNYLLKNLKLINSELDKDKVSTKNQRCDYVAELKEAKKIGILLSAKKMVNSGMSLREIAKILEISIDELKNL